MGKLCLVPCLVFVAAIAACGPSKVSHDGGNGGDDDAGSSQPHPHTLVGLSVTPVNPLVELDLNATAAQDFMVTGMYADDTQEDLTAQVSWTVANPAVGAFTASQLAIPGFTTAQAITSKLTASYNGVDGLAQITVVAHRPQDFFFILPYNDPNGPANRPLTFATAIPQLDVFF